MKYIGKVITAHRTFGFISPDDLALPEVFYHRTGLIGRQRLALGEVVEFEIGEFNGKTVAVNVRVIVPIKLSSVASEIGGNR